MRNEPVVVIGAGVIGLQIAIALLKAGYTVSVVAQYFPGDENELYSSPWAGANWRTHASKDDTEQCDWDTQTYEAWKELLDEERRTGRTGGSGLKFVRGVQYWDAATGEVEHGVQSVWWASVVDDAREIPEQELPEGAKFGLKYSTFVINVPKFLAYLNDQIEALGGVLHRTTLPMDQGIEAAIQAAGHAAGIDQPFIAVNATGIWAKGLVGDDAMDAVQGQTVLVRGEANGQVCRIGKDPLDVCVIIPRPGSGTTVVGSSRDPGNWDVQVRDEVTLDLLRKGKMLAPELLNGDGEFDVIAPNAGLRPYRRGGARVEIERLPKRNILVVHAYGHGGAGFQNSVGTASKVLRLLEEVDRP